MVGDEHGGDEAVDGEDAAEDGGEEGALDEDRAEVEADGREPMRTSAIQGERALGRSSSREAIFL